MICNKGPWVVGMSIRRSSDVPVPDLSAHAHKICHHLSHELHNENDCSYAPYMDCNNENHYS